MAGVAGLRKAKELGYPHELWTTRLLARHAREHGPAEGHLSLVEVTYPPGTSSPPHLHANGVMAFVVSGTVTSKVGDGPEQIFHAGDAWWEPPGAIHRVSRNASSAEPARLLAIYIAPRGATSTDLMKPI